MRHLKIALITLLLAFIPGLLLVHAVGAQRFSNAVADDQTVNGSLYSASKVVTIKGTINGDIFCAGEQVIIDATVNGDVICAAKQLTLTGKVDGDVRLAGQNVSIDADITRSATVAAADFSLDASASIGRDLTATGATLNIKGAVGRDIVASGTEVTINGAAGRNVSAQTDRLIIKDDAAIKGNVRYTSNSKAEVASKAQLNRDAVTQSKPQNDGIFSGSGLLFYLALLSGMLLVALVLIVLAPRFVQRVNDSITANALRALLVGFVTSIALPMAIILCAIAIVGIPLAIVLTLVWLLTMLLSSPIVGYVIGRQVIKNKQASPLVIMLVGSLIVLVGYALPLVGFLGMIVGYWFGLGGLLLAIRDSQRTIAQVDK